MAKTHKLTWSLVSNDGVFAGGKSCSGSVTEVGSSEPTVDVLIPASSTDQPVSIAFAVAAVQSCFILADQDCTLETNNGASPANTISLKAGMPYVFSKSANYNADKFTVDVTGWFITNTNALRLRAWILTS